jgi:Alpha-mannosidase
MIKITVISHTHWDREWNQPFQFFRKRLVDMMSELLDKLENDPDYRYFHFDGQTVVLEDYLEIVPDDLPRIAKLISEGRLIVGPWYDMPDEAMPSGEALTRNLLLGHTITEAFGGRAMKSGYIVDIFGHTSQLPQILRGFGIDNAVLSRGMGEYMKSEFWWDAPDGSRILGLKRDEDRLYSDFYFAVRDPFYGREYNNAELIERFGKHIKYITERSLCDSVLMLDGVDNIDVEQKLPYILDLFRKNFSEVEIVHGTIEDYVKEVYSGLESCRDIGYFCGEQRETGKNGLNNVVLKNVLSSRVHLKQANVECENALTAWFEPLGVFTSPEFGFAGGKKYPSGFAAKAWRYLLRNDPHDSIGGCSMTEVHEDMVYRYNQCRWIAESIIEDRLKLIAGSIDASELRGDRVLTLFNPCQSDYCGIYTVELKFPTGAAHPGTIKIYGDGGEELPFQILAIRRGVVETIIEKSHYPGAASNDWFLVAVKVSVPGLGYKAIGYGCAPGEALLPSTYALVNERKPKVYTGSLRTAPNRAENALIALEIKPDGTLSLTDKASGVVYTGLLRLEDESDVGDGWTWRPTPENLTSLGLEEVRNISLVYDGPNAVCFRVVKKLSLPENHSGDGTKRSENLKEGTVIYDVTVSADSAEVKIKLTVDNVWRGHRMKAAFSIPDNNGYFYTNNAYDFIKRPVKRKDYSEYREEHSPTVPNHGIVAADNGKNGLAIFNKGLYEAEMRECGEIALTLFRSTASEVNNIVHDGGQELRKLSFELAITPYKTADGYTALIHKHQKFALGMRSLCVPKTECKGTMQPEHRFISVRTQNCIVTALKRSERIPDEYILRFYNNSDEADTLTAEGSSELAEASYANLNEEHTEAIKFIGKTLKATAAARKIITIAVRFK